MSRFVRPVTAHQVGLQHIIVRNDPATMESLVDEMSDLLADINSASPDLFKDTGVQNKLRRMLEKYCGVLEDSGTPANDPIASFADEPDTSEDDGVNEIVELEDRDIQDSIYRSQIDADIEGMILWSSLGLLRRVAYAKGVRKPVQQINAVILFHTFVDALGIKYFDPRGEAYFQEYLNKAMSAGLIKYSAWIAKEGIRAYRNAEQSGRMIQLNKVPGRNDPSKVTDYYSFIADGGRTTALKQLRNLGVSEAQIQELSSTIVLNVADEVQMLRTASEDVESRITR